MDDFYAMHITLPVEVNDADPAKLAKLANTAKSSRPVCKLIKVVVTLDAVLME
jgi:hypothetical protein